MGDIENKSRKRKARNDLKKIILTSVKLAGYVSLALLAPNAVQYLEKAGFKPIKRQREVMARSRDKLLQNGFLGRENGLIRITEKGLKYLEGMEIRDWKISKPKKWDKRWRMLIFDIPETRKILRNKVRLTLSSVGFLRLQDSVWIYPYDCEDFINLLKADFKIGKDLLYIIADSIEGDKRIRKLFSLSLD
ncbi:MAG: hypothetical protein WAX44_00645 [Minisyncoccia bacterium]